jgi:XTP/dITP diphosphohydrolase
MKLIFASNNKHKLEEVSHILGKDYKIISLKDLDINEDIPEDYHTLEENALFKARFANKITDMDVFADDTGLEIESLNGRPGVHSARFAGAGRNFDANIDKVLLLMSGADNRNARFRTVIALIIDKKEFIFEGIVEGTILHERRGTMGFGYDPIFLPRHENLTFAEMSLSDKNRISHRALAFEKLKIFLSQYRNTDNKHVK